MGGNLNKLKAEGSRDERVAAVLLTVGGVVATSHVLSAGSERGSTVSYRGFKMKARFPA